MPTMAMREVGHEDGADMWTQIRLDEYETQVKFKGRNDILCKYRDRHDTPAQVRGPTMKFTLQYINSSLRTCNTMSFTSKRTKTFPCLNMTRHGGSYHNISTSGSYPRARHIYVCLWPTISITPPSLPPSLPLSLSLRTTI